MMKEPGYITLPAHPALLHMGRPEFERLRWSLPSAVVETESARFRKEEIISENPEFPFPPAALLSLQPRQRC